MKINIIKVLLILVFLCCLILSRKIKIKKNDLKIIKVRVEITQKEKDKEEKIITFETNMYTDHDFYHINNEYVGFLFDEVPKNLPYFSLYHKENLFLNALKGRYFIKSLDSNFDLSQGIEFFYDDNKKDIKRIIKIFSIDDDGKNTPIFNQINFYLQHYLKNNYEQKRSICFLDNLISEIDLMIFKLDEKPDFLNEKNKNDFDFLFEKMRNFYFHEVYNELIFHPRIKDFPLFPREMLFGLNEKNNKSHFKHILYDLKRFFPNYNNFTFCEKKFINHEK